MCADQKSALFDAVKQGDKVQVEKLIKQGVDVNADTGIPGYPGQTALMFAAQHGNTEIMKQLIQAGADVHAASGVEQPHVGKPVLRYAIDSGSVQAVNVLLDAGADPNGITESPIIVEKGPSNANVRNLILLSYAINSHAPIEIIKTLIAHGAEIHSVNRAAPGNLYYTYWTPLMLAAFRGYDQAVLALLDAGADVNVVNKNHSNRTVLDYAREGGFSTIVRILQEHYFKSSSCKN